MKTRLVLTTILATLLAVGVPPQVCGHDAGQLDRQTAGKVYSAKPVYSPYPGAISPPVLSSATLIFTPHFSWTRGHSVRA